MEIKSAVVVMQGVVSHYAMDWAQREAWKTICAALEEIAPSASPNNARDEICSRCDNDEALARIFGGGQFSFCPKCGRKLSPVA